MRKTLFTIVIIALALLSIAFSLQGVTKKVAQREHIELMELLLPGGKDFVKVEYTGEDELIRSVHKSSKGYVIETSTYGYADEITVYTGLDNSGTVTGLVVYDARETLGLGSKILTDHEFLAQFLNKTGSFTIGSGDSDAFSAATGESSSSGNEVAVDGISGATVSSKTVAKLVTSAVGYVTGADIQSSATSWEGN